MECWVDPIAVDSADGHRLYIAELSLRLLRLAALAEESGVKGAERAALAMKAFALGLQRIAGEVGEVIERCRGEGASLAVSLAACQAKNSIFEFMRASESYRHPALTSAYESALRSLGVLYDVMDRICSAGGSGEAGVAGLSGGLP